MEGDHMHARQVYGGWTVAVAVSLAAVGLMAGCQGAAERLNAPPQGQSDRPAEMQDTYARMVDNAMLAERSMSPVHFVPGSSELNSLGVRRLNRYATLLKVYGGNLCYDGIEDSPELAEQRLYQMQQILLASGVGPDQVSLQVGVAGGRGMSDLEADEARKGMSVMAEDVHQSKVRIITEAR